LAHNFTARGFEEGMKRRINRPASGVQRMIDRIWSMRGAVENLIL
jgi:hypothetical protein